MLIDRQMLDDVFAVATPHFRAMRDEMILRYRDRPDAVFAVAVGLAVGSLLASVGVPEQPASA